MEILTKENLLSGAKNSSHCSFQDFHSLTTKGNQVSFSKDSPLPHGKSADVGGGGSNRDADGACPDSIQFSSTAGIKINYSVSRKMLPEINV